jgi:hypothetical protein
MTKSFLVFALTPLLMGVCIAQERTWREWSKTEAEKILNNSAWGQTQTETDTSEMVYRPTSVGTGAIGRPDASRGPAGSTSTMNNSRADRGATNQAISVNYRVRLLSAKPVRQAFLRVISIAQKKPDPDLTDGLEAFVNRDFKDFIVVAITVDSTDGRFAAPAQEAFATARIGTVKNIAYLERKDGKRVFPIEYHPPITDGLGAKFIFPRRVDEREFLNANSGSFRFYCEMNSQLKLNVTFKIADVTY